MYTREQLEILSARLTELSRLKDRLKAINAHDMSFNVRIEVKSKDYSFSTDCKDKAIIDILKNGYESRISRLENKISSTTILDIDAL